MVSAAEIAHARADRQELLESKLTFAVTREDHPAFFEQAKEEARPWPPSEELPSYTSMDEAMSQGPIHKAQAVMINGKRFLLSERPVSFSSKRTSKSERKMLGAELELRGLRWAFYFYRIYLEGSRVGIVTDHQPLKSMLLAGPHRQFTPVIEAVRQELRPFCGDWSFHYKPGRLHVNVDSLSRLRQLGSADPTLQIEGSDNEEPDLHSTEPED